jgi:hypothetical protein
LLFNDAVSIETIQGQWKMFNGYGAVGGWRNEVWHEYEASAQVAHQFAIQVQI